MVKTAKKALLFLLKGGKPLGFAVLSLLLAAGTAATPAGASEAVTNVRGAQRADSRLVDIYYDLESDEGGAYTVTVEIEGRTNAVSAATFTGDVGEGVTPGRNRHIVWNAGADWPGKKGDVRAIVTAVKKTDGEHNGVQLWEGGPYWADRNIGASSPTDSGLYFWWGDTTGYRPSGNTFGFSFGSANTPTYSKSIDQLQSEGWIVNNNGTYALAPAHDAARAHWGGSWRMPTLSELGALNSSCDWTWTTRNGVNGYVVRGRGAYASASIFLPCAGDGLGTSLGRSGSFGYYWSSVPYSDFDSSWDLGFGSGYHDADYYSRRYLGQSVRPVQGFAK